jgi:hypothetical protein
MLANWNKYDHSNSEDRKALLNALQFFVSLPNKYVPESLKTSERFTKRHAIIQAAQRHQAEFGRMPTPVELQAFATPGDFPPSLIDVIQKFHAVMNYDNGYEQIFDIHNAENSKKPGFSISNVTSGMTFNQILPGEKVLVEQMRGTRAFVYYHYYAGALGWHKQLFDDEEWWTIEDNAIEFTNKAYYERARVFYALLEAAMDAKTCATLVDIGCDDCNEYYIALAQAINNAAVTILNAVQNKGYGVSPTGTSFIVLAPLQQMDRVRKALNINLQPFQGSEKQVNFNFRPITTMMLTNTDRIGVILPKIRLKGGYRMDLQVFNSFDMLSYTEAAAGWMRYGGAVGDLDQIECIDPTAVSGLVGG